MMGAVTMAAPVAGTRMTLEDWLALPEADDRVELIEGVVAVTSSPTEPHQAIVTGLVMVLGPACPPEFRVRVGPLGVLVRDLTSGLLPDLVVVREDDRATLDRFPVLVVEVLSPSTRGRDQVEKRRLYAHRGIASYWLLDPGVPDLRVLELGVHGDYVEVAHVSGSEPVDLHRPYPIRLVPDELLR